MISRPRGFNGLSDGRERRRRAVPFPAGLPLALAAVLLVPFVCNPTAAATPHSVYEDFFARPQYQVYFTRKMVKESALLPSADLVVLPGPSGSRWACRIPEAAEEVEEQMAERKDPEADRKEAAGKLDGLRAGCLYYMQGWFTYEYCQWVSSGA